MGNNELIDNGVLAIGNTFDYNSSKRNENKVNGLINYLTDNGFKYEDHVDMSVIYFSKEYKGEEWLFSLTEPHEGNGNQWLWRAEKRSNFERWGSTYFEESYMNNGHFISCAIKEFENKADKYNEVDKIYDDDGNEIISEEVVGNENSPYLETIRTVKYNTKKYNPKYGDNRLCICGHPYYRHFDSWEDMYPCGCKYCSCDHFVEDEKIK